MQRKWLVLSLGLLAIFSITACGAINALLTGKQLTPVARYYDALQTFNANVIQYNAIFKLSDAATQAKYRAQIDPVIRTASMALDTWKEFLNTPAADSKEKIWSDISKNLIGLLLQSGIIKVEG